MLSVAGFFAEREAFPAREEVYSEGRRSLSPAKKPPFFNILIKSVKPDHPFQEIKYKKGRMYTGRLGRRRI